MNAVLGHLLAILVEVREAGLEHNVADQATKASTQEYHGRACRIFVAQALKPAITLDPSHGNWCNHTRKHETHNEKGLNQSAFLKLNTGNRNTCENFHE